MLICGFSVRFARHPRAFSPLDACLSAALRFSLPLVDCKLVYPLQFQAGMHAPGCWARFLDLLDERSPLGSAADGCAPRLSPSEDSPLILVLKAAAPMSGM